MEYDEIMTLNEINYMYKIKDKDSRLRKLLIDKNIPEGSIPDNLFNYWECVKNLLGNISNDLSLLAAIMAKKFIINRFGYFEFDVAEKAQGARGLDIDVKIPTYGGSRIIGEIKTTKPYQPGFGSSQRYSIIKDLERLSNTDAEFKFMFVTDKGSFDALNTKKLREKYACVEIINLNVVG